MNYIVRDKGSCQHPCKKIILNSHTEGPMSKGPGFAQEILQYLRFDLSVGTSPIPMDSPEVVRNESHSIGGSESMQLRRVCALEIRPRRSRGLEQCCSHSP